MPGYIALTKPRLNGPGRRTSAAGYGLAGRTTDVLLMAQAVVNSARVGGAAGTEPVTSAIPTRDVAYASAPAARWLRRHRTHARSVCVRARSRHPRDRANATAALLAIATSSPIS